MGGEREWAGELKSKLITVNGVERVLNWWLQGELIAAIMSLSNKELNSMNDLTTADREAKFLKGVYEGLRLDEAAKNAGYTHGSRDAYPILARPETRKYFKKVIRGRAETEGLSVAYGFLIETVRDEKAPKKDRLDAAKFLYANNMAAPKAVEIPDEKEEKDINSMSNEELRSFIETVEGELSDRAAPAEGPQALDDYM